jgi:hypothetical protein
MEQIEEIPPQVFISYSHDSDEHKNWIIQLATRLRSNGVDVILDVWNTNPKSTYLKVCMEGNMMNEV